MGLQEMIDRIDKEAEKEAKVILDEAEKEAKTIESTSGKEISGELAELERKLDKELRTTRNIYVSEGKRKARQAILCSKEDLIWETISEVRKRLSSMEGSGLSVYLLPLYDKAEEALGSDMSVHPVRDVDAEVLSGKNGVERSLESSDVLPDAVRRFKGKDLLGGLIANTSDGNRVVNMSFHGLLEKEEETIREIIARTLFGE